MQRNLIQTSYFAPRGRDRMYDLGMQIGQMYLSPYDRLIGFIGDAGSGKSALIHGMFPGLELTNDDDGVNVRPLPILDVTEQHGFYTPHTYHLDIRFEMGFTQPHVLAGAIMDAINLNKRVIVEHFDLIRPHLTRNADLLIGVGEQVVVTRPTMFGPEPSDLVDEVHRSLRYRLMAHTAEDLCEMHMDPKLIEICHHDDIHHGFIMSFYEYPPQIDLADMERRVKEDISRDLPVAYADESHIRVGTRLHSCNGPRTHVTTTGKIEGFRLYPEIIFDDQRNRYLVVGFVGEHSQDRIDKLRKYNQAPDMLSPFIY
jgi:hypothetical protein